MAEPTTGVCGPWLLDTSTVTECCQGLSDPPPSQEQLDRALAFATNVLFRLSGRQFSGLCERTVRPCSGSGGGCGCDGWSGDGYWSFWWWDAMASSWWSAFPISSGFFPSLCGSCAGKCSLPSVLLPMPVTEVTEVIVNGVVLTVDVDYKVENYRRLVRVDGNGWPCNNNRLLDSSEGGDEGTWQVTYTYGRGPGLDGEMAVARYACEIAKLLCGSDSCALPQRVKNIDREGVDMAMMDPLWFISNGRTGVDIVDTWLNSVNPNRIKRRAHAARMGAPREMRNFT